ncbi:MAG: SUMF1/EgtB/PvdO family nonheme iron enzyme [Acidobacteriota bacterium]|nr:MAG: SUMF1/EgtB/PvdO family nonheme iron enzyme [Acidobacteriota bacterium]
MTGSLIRWVLGILLLLVVAAGAAWFLTRAGAERKGPEGFPQEAVREIIHGRDESQMVVVPAGEFVMGTSETHPELRELPEEKPLRPLEVVLAHAAPAWRHEDERPARTVGLDGFAIDRYEVTNARYRKFLEWIQATGDHGRCHPEEPRDKDHTPRYWRDYNPLLADSDYARTTPFHSETFTADDTPVVGIDWFDAFAYAAWAGKRLPTEAEWERAARGLDGRRWPWGDDWHWGYANLGGEKKGMDISAKGYEKDGFIYPAPVGSFEKGVSPVGCYDMAGNVLEWCADWYRSDYYSTAPDTDPPGPEAGAQRAVRGGGSQNYPSYARCAERFFYEPEFRNFTLGFRCAKDL